MADAYCYPLLVELEQNDTPKLKNKLVKYFQSKKSNGGDCEVDYENGSKTATLRFRKEEDQRNVLRKGNHEIPLDKGIVKMTVRLLTAERSPESPPAKLKRKSNVAVNNEQTSEREPTPETKVQPEAKGRDEETPDEDPGITRAVLGNIDEKLNQEFLEMLVENIIKDHDSQSDSPGFTLELIPNLASAVVTFQSGKECNNFVIKGPQHRMFKNKSLSVRPLEVTAEVLAEDVQDFSEDLIRLYFENEGGDVENIVLNEVEQSAIITFKDHKDAKKIMKEKIHCIKKKKFKVYPFYKSLETALYGKDKPQLKSPAPISETIDMALWRYLNERKSAAEAIQSDLAKHFCNVKLNTSTHTVDLSPLSSLVQQKDAKAIIKDWRDAVKTAFVRATSKYKSLKFNLESDAWEESEEKIREMLQKEDVVVVPDKANGVLAITGCEDHVNRFEKPLFEVINKVVQRVQREKSTITQDIKVSPPIFHLLCQDGLKDNLLKVYPELKMSFRSGSPDLALTGLSEEIIAANKAIYDAMFALKRQNLETDQFVLELLKYEDQEELTQVLLISKGINAAFEISPQRVQLLAASDRDLNDADEHVRKLLVSQHIDVEDSNVLKKPEWQQLVSQLKNVNSKSCKRIQIHTTGQQVVVCGYRDNVQKVRSELHQFLTQNAHIEEKIVVKHSAIIKYIQHDTSCLEQLEDKVVVTYTNDSICLSGCRSDVSRCQDIVEDFVSSLFFDSLKIAKPGAKKFYKDKESLYAGLLFQETGCLVQLVDETSDEQDDAVTQPVYQIKTSDGVDIVVCKADLCSYPVCAVVNSANQDLKLNGGLAGALSKAAGSQLQAECDRVIRDKGQLKPGDCIITDAGGRLACKKVIHTVGPTFDQTSNKSNAQLRKSVKVSLELAKMHGCISVALPAISRSQGFPLMLCAITIVQAVKEYCDEMCDDDYLKRIHLVDNEDNVVQALEAAVRKEFGNSGVSYSQQTPRIKPIKSSPIKRPGSPGSDPNCLGQAQTKDGLDITLMKGNIENATTEVTVNTIVKDLTLNVGAVSNAILSAAGPKLQELVKATNAKATVGEIIVTDGCNLKSKHVFHAVSPHWDKGQGTSEKSLSGIFKDCLDKAESTGLTSISFPAIGTGNLGFSKDFVATSMLDEILAFSKKKQPKHLKKVVIILYPGDTQTIQVFSDTFKKLFPSATYGPASTSSSQSKGPFSKVVSSSGLHETKMGSVVIQVATGDITKETTDVIVNSSNETFSLKSGVSKAILDAAGPTVEAECQNLAAQPNQGMIMTQPGNLKCKKILHLTGQTCPVKIRKTVKDALQMCVQNTYTSVSFPAIGTGQGNVQAGQVADAMLDAVIDVLSKHTSGPLTTIRIVIFQPLMLKDFHNSMSQREVKEVTDTKDKVWTWGDIGSKIKSFFIGGNHSKPQKDEDFITEPLKVDPACFHICSNSQTNVDSAKQWINDMIIKELHTNTIPENMILNFSDADYQRIVDIQKTEGVSIKIESKKGQATVFIEGLSKDVLKATGDILEMVRKTKDNEELNKKIEFASTVAEWQYLQPGLQFQSFDQVTNYDLEQALENQLKAVKVKIQGQDYTVTMPSGPATDSQGRTMEIKRIDKLKDQDIPDHWDLMPAKATSHPFTVQPGSAEHSEVLSLFQATCNRTVTKIERIQNPTLWKSLQIKKRDMEQRNGHQNNMRRLFHGTCHTTVTTINELGFNRSYAGMNAACYGNGTYFAVQASYSASDTYSKPSPSKDKFMYLCQVLTGDFTLGQQNMIVPPAKGAMSVQKYDSVVDNVTRPSMFVIFHDTQAYPEYLITFK